MNYPEYLLNNAEDDINKFLQKEIEKRHINPLETHFICTHKEKFVISVHFKLLLSDEIQFNYTTHTELTDDEIIFKSIHLLCMQLLNVDYHTEYKAKKFTLMDATIALLIISMIVYSFTHLRF